MSSGVGADGLVMGLALLFMGPGKAFLEWSMGLGQCGVGM